VGTLNSRVMKKNMTRCLVKTSTHWMGSGRMTSDANLNREGFDWEWMSKGPPVNALGPVIFWSTRSFPKTLLIRSQNRVASPLCGKHRQNQKVALTQVRQPSGLRVKQVTNSGDGT